MEEKGNDAIIPVDANPDFKDIDPHTQGLLRAYRDSNTAYADLSRLKQKRLLAKVNKDLRKNDMDPVTHMDMMKKSYWESLKGVHRDLAKSIAVTMITLDKVLNAECLPDDVKASENLGRLRKHKLELELNFYAVLQKIRARHWTEEEGYREGIIPYGRLEEYEGIFKDYIELRTELLVKTTELEEPLHALLSIIKELRKGEEEDATRESV